MTNPVDTSQEAIDALTERLWEYGTVVGKPLSSQDAVCHDAAHMIEALCSQLTARDELLRDAMPPSSTDYNLIAREDWYSKRDAIYGPRPSAVPKAPIPKYLDTQDDWMDNDD